MNDNTDKKLPVPTGKAPEHPASPRLWPLWLLIILLVIAAAGLGMAAWDQHREQQRLAERLTERVEQVENRTESVRADQQQTRQAREERLNRLESKLDDKSQQLETQARQIDHNARSLLGLGQRTRTDWLLAEAEYLIRLANQRLLFEDDYRGALMMLESADKVLAETDDAGTYPVREQLARDILALRTIEPVDRTGLYLQLEAGMGMADELRNRQLRQPARRDTQPEPADELAADWDWADAWDRVRQTFSGIVTIRRLDDPVKPLLSPEQETQARLHLQLMMEEAALALLRSDQVTYQRALKRARGWLNDWYDPKQSRVQALDKLLGDLSNQKIDPVLPDISRSLDHLKSRIQLRLEEVTEQEEENGGDDDADNGEEPAS